MKDLAYYKSRKRDRGIGIMYVLVACIISLVLGFIIAQNWIISTQKVIYTEGNSAYIEVFNNVYEYGIGD